MKRLVVAVLALGVIGGGGYWYYRYSKKPTPPTVATAAVTRGDIVESVGATGTLQAVTTVQVGTQVSGTIQSLNADFNSLVKKGQVIARLDPSLFQTQIAQARANLVRAQADLERLKVALSDAQSKLNRARELSTRQLIPRTDLETAEVNVQTAQAQIQSQQAQIAQAQATLNQNQVNIEHTVITAPIDGLVISRNVDVGQTVAASMQAPTLFVLAADLTKMQVLANLDESDVGRIRPKQTVTFRVDAYPQDTFRGTVSQVRLQPVVQQNVVTYATVIDVPNDDLRLKPGMTANVNVEISRATNVLRVPNAALRFRPSTDIFAALGQTPPEPQGRSMFQPGGGRGGSDNSQGGPAPLVPASDSSAQPSAPNMKPSGGAATMDSNHSADTGSQRSRGSRADAPANSQEAVPNLPRGAEGSGGQEQSSAAQADDRRNRFAERMQNMSPEEREAFTARLRERGIDPNNPPAGFGRGGFGRGGGTGADSGGPTGRGQSADSGKQPGSHKDQPPNTPASAQGKATTIDALFAPLPRTESVGRVWRYIANQLQPTRLRLGISDGQNTEIIEGDLKEGAEVVTNVAIAGQSTRPATSAFPGFGPGGGRGFGGGFPGGGGGRGR